MAVSTSFEVISLGKLSFIDGHIGLLGVILKNDYADYASSILGTYGSEADMLANHVHTLTAISLAEDGDDSYDTDNGGG